MNIAVVILNWNGRDLLAKFLPSVVKYSSGEATVYVADNASTDDSVSYINTNFPTVKIIQNTSNGGFAKGYNDALKNLSESGTINSEDIIVLLNSDVEVTQNWLSPVVSEFIKDPKLVAAQPKILDYNKRDYFEYAGAAGGFIDKLGYPYCRGRIFNSLEKDLGQYNDITDIFWATGACLFVKTEAFLNIGGFDEDFFTHQEEIDLCWRLLAQGGLVKYIGTATIYHVGGATLAAANPKKTFYNFRNTLLVLIKNVKSNGVWWLVFLRLMLDGVAAILFLFQGKPKHFIAIAKAHISFYGLLSSFISKRKKHASPLKYYSIKSIVLNYFILKKRIY